MTKEQLIEKYELENKNILKRRSDLNMNGDFTPDGIKVFCNTGFIADLKELNIPVVSNSKADKIEKAYQKHFRDDPQFRGRSYRLRDNYIFHKDEAYECINYYLRTGTTP